MTRRIAIAVTGASGSIYAERLIKSLQDKVERLYLMATDAGRSVAQHELTRRSDDNCNLLSLLDGALNENQKKVIRIFKNDDLFAPIASGSSSPTDMVIIPASMGTLARIAYGLSSNLIERTADVVLKEKKKLIIVPRETPFNTIHLENMLRLSQMGVHVVPAMPAFYNKPQSLDDAVDFVVGRVLDALTIDHDMYRRWNPRMV